MSDKLFDFSIEWDGIDELLKGLDNVADEVIEAMKQGVSEDAENLLNVAMQLAPKLDATLEGSGHVGKIQNTGVGIQQRVIFNSPYALRRHEEPYRPGRHIEYDASKRPVEVIDGRGAYTRSKPSVDGMEPGRKYLERPLKRYFEKYQKHIADKIKEVLAK